MRKENAMQHLLLSCAMLTASMGGCNPENMLRAEYDENLRIEEIDRARI